MNILFTRFPYVSARGGAERQTQWLAKGLIERGHSVSFLGSCHPLSSMFKEIGAESHHLSLGLPPVTLWLAISFLWRRTAIQKKLIAAMEKLPHTPDVLVMLSLTEKLLLTAWAASHGIKVFWVEHDRIGRWLTKNPWLKSLRKAAAHATIICVSDLSASMMTDIGFDRQRIIAIPNGIPFPADHPEKKASESHEVNVGVIARLSPEKGIDTLIRALLDLPEINLTVVGVGREEGYLKSLMFEDAQRVGIQRMKLIAHMEDLEKFYHSLDVFVLPSSDHDPFGLVAAEAMARGIATVVTDACGIAASLENGKDALITEAGSAESLEAALRRLLDPDTRSRLAAEGRLTARTCFSLQAMTDAYEAAFRTP
ncbi:MAG: glycosyltransferase family 4 protein [Candidatus Peribacteraceae bacterium]|nr:glycosyltransferase family 4 protein [Candidatus Peribacteraceae bacterium]